VHHGGPRYSESLATVVTSRGQLVNARILQWRLALPWHKSFLARADQVIE